MAVVAWQPDYATVAELADYARADEVADATELGLAVTAASRAVDRFTRRQFGQTDTAEERFYAPSWSVRRGAWLVLTDDMAVTPTEVATSADGVTFTVVSSSVLLPRNAAPERRPWTMLQLPESISEIAIDGVRVTTQFGWTATPDTVRQATLLQGSRVFTRRDAPFGIAGSPDQGSELRLLAKLDPDVQVMLADYRLRPLKVG